MVYKHIENEICKNLRKCFKNKPKAELLERILFSVLKLCKYNYMF